NPVMFVVWVCAVLTTVLAIQALVGHGEAPWTFILAIAFWLWVTLLFANFAEAMAEGRGKAQAESLRKTRRDVVAKRLASAGRARQRHCHSPPQGRLRAGRERRRDPVRRRGRRRRGLGRRERRHRRERARDPRERR